MTIKSLENWHQEEQLIADYIRNKSSGEPICILEAGCGRKWDQSDLLKGVPYKLVGVDLDRKAMEYRRDVLKDLDEFIHDDLRRVDFQPNSFDVIFSSFVLEHIEGAENVLEKFTHWLKPEGFLILRIPDPNTVYGFSSRILPFGLHLLYARYLGGLPNAGKEGNGPYPTFYDPVVSQIGIYNFCKANSLSIQEELCDAYFHNVKVPPYPSQSKVSQIVSTLSMGMLVGNHRNLLYILQKS